MYQKHASDRQTVMGFTIHFKFNLLNIKENTVLFHVHAQ